LDGYHEVTNADFQEFVDATGYITTAEQAGLGGTQKQLPPDKKLNLLRKVYNLPL
jgi:formylglycine-generating enzyme required for sulfatase activity